MSKTRRLTRTGKTQHHTRQVFLYENIDFFSIQIVHRTDERLAWESVISSCSNFSLVVYNDARALFALCTSSPYRLVSVIATCRPNTVEVESVTLLNADAHFRQLGHQISLERSRDTGSRTQPSVWCSLTRRICQKE